MFSPEEKAACQKLIELAMDEDLSTPGDLTSQSLIPSDQIGAATFVARASGVLAGLECAEMTLAHVDRRTRFELLKSDGAHLAPGNAVALAVGPMRSLLIAERTALNFLQYMSGIASSTHRFVEAIKGTSCKILDTRKTLPGFRLLAKYAVRAGGGHNHRMGLHDWILIKDNHLAAMGGGLAEVTEAVRHARDHVGHAIPVQIEVDRIDQLDKALAANPDMILLDNMSLDQLRDAVHRRNQANRAIQLEASGGIGLSTLRNIAETGVDRISVGALTHSVIALDIGLDYCDPPGTQT